MKDNFSRLNANEKSQAQNKRHQQPESEAISPVPDTVKLAIPEHYQLGVHTTFWDYRDARGRLLYLVCRFVDKDGNKEDRPLTYRKSKSGKSAWEWKALEQPRPLYGLDRLAKRLNAPVLVCEGEKATEAAPASFPGHVAITSPNGAESAHAADWSAVKGREVTIWPDNDNEGQKYAGAVARLAKKAGAASVSIVEVPENFPEKWDLADELPNGVTQADLDDLLGAAKPVVDPLENLVERAKASPGNAFTDEVLKALAELQDGDLPAFVNLRQKLKAANVGITMLDDAVKEHAVKSGEDMSGPDHLELAREVIDCVGAENIIDTSAHVWRWKQTGVWRPVVERAVKQDVQRSLENAGHAIKRGLVDSVVDVLKTEIHLAEHEWDQEKNAINVLNGELYWMGTEWELREHVREHYRTTQLPIKFDPLATCPRFSKFLNEIFQDDVDAADKAQLILEMIGYTLVSHADYERFALLVGPGANGKSVVLEVVGALVGRQNVSAVQPSQFSQKFQRAHLHLKLANLVTEIAEGAEIADAELKAITSGELTTAEHKNKDPFDFRPFCTCWFGTNHMPHTRDFSNALFRRALVIPFNRTFEAGVNADPKLKTKLLAELPGILNLALAAFGQVIVRGNFTEPESCQIAKKEWRVEADQVAQFFAERCSLDATASISSRQLYKEYWDWTLDAGIARKLNRKNFTNRIQLLGGKLQKGTGGTRMIAGVCVRSG